MRSTTELQQRCKSAGLCEARPEKSSNLRRADCFGKVINMKKPLPKTKDDRLAEALRANLRRRKHPKPEVEDDHAKPDIGQM